MQQIKIDTKYVPLVLNGTKIQTIRFGRREYKLGPAVLVADSKQIPVNITNVDFISSDRLDVYDAKADGFNTLNELKSALLLHYPEITDQSLITVVSFERTRY